MSEHNGKVLSREDVRALSAKLKGSGLTPGKRSQKPEQTIGDAAITATSERVLDLLRRGIAAIPAPRGKKGITRKGWQSERYAEADVCRVFKSGDNIAGLMGSPSGRVDIDLDCDEAAVMAGDFLPDTGEVFGRTSRPRTHRLYRVAEPMPKTTKFATPGRGGETLVELRSTGCYTIMPGSTHPDGDAYRWDSDSTPAAVDGDELPRAAARLAAACLVVRSYPAEGGRHNMILALAGVLLRSGWSIEDVEHFIRSVAAAADDNQIEDRLAAVRSTAEKLQTGEGVTGLPTLAELLGHDTAKLLRKWLGLTTANTAAAIADDVPYTATPVGIMWAKPSRDGVVDTLLCNFTARIVAEVERDDGAETERMFQIEATLNGRTVAFVVSASRFAAMNWPVEHLGAGAIIFASQSYKDHARVAIQLTSPHPIPRQVTYTHTGWRKIGNEWAYLHGSGAIGTSGCVEGVAVELPAALSLYQLPQPPEGEQLAEAIRASLHMLVLGPDPVIIPLYAAIWRAPLGPSDFGLHLAGASGVFKSETAALDQQHFGPGLDARHLPGSWSSTDNFIEQQMFAAKDALFVADDYAPAGTIADVQRLNQKADRVFRSAGNGSARGRMRADGSLRPVKSSRCLIASTGEDCPKGHSLGARLLKIEVAKGDIRADVLTTCQRNARAGLYAAAMAGFVRWLASRYEQVKQGLRAEIEALRDRAVGCASHCRTPEIVANLALGLKYFVAFAVDAGAMSEAEGQALWQRGWEALQEAGAKQGEHQTANEPAARFIELLRSAVGSGHAHLANRDGTAPKDAAAWGWRLTGRTSIDWQPQGDRVGWVDGEHIYLLPDAAYRAVQSMAGQGDGLAISARTLRKRLAERGLLIRAEGDRLTVTRKLEGREQDVLCMSVGVMLRDSGFSGGAGANRVLDPANAGETPKTHPENPPPPPVFGVRNRGANPLSGLENGGEPRTPRTPRNPPAYTPRRLR